MTAVIRLKTGQLAKYMALKGVKNKSALAELMRVDRATVVRTTTGQAQPGALFIGALLRAFPELSFEDLFDVDQVPEQRDGHDDPVVETTDGKGVPV